MGSQGFGHDWAPSRHFINDSDNNSPETLFDTKTDNTFLDDNDKSVTQSHIFIFLIGIY